MTTSKNGTCDRQAPNRPGTAGIRVPGVGKARSMSERPQPAVVDVNSVLVRRREPRYQDTNKLTALT
jgi:hypothetical protein